MIGSLRPSVGEGIELGQVESFGPYQTLGDGNHIMFTHTFDIPSIRFEISKALWMKAK